MALHWLSKLIGAVVVLFCLQASVAPLRAESAVKKIGVLALSEADSIDALFASLRDFGWIDGQTMTIVFPKASSDPAKLEANMGELLAARVDMVVAQTKLAIQIARQATASVPIVMGALNGDPVAEGFVQRLDHPGGDITGSYYNVTSGGAERVDALAKMVPAMTRIGIVMNPASKPSQALAADLADAAHRHGLAVTEMPVRDGADVDAAFAAAQQQGVQGVVSVTGAEMFAIRKEIVAAQNKYRIPAVMGSIGYAEMGGLAKLGPDIPSLWRKMAPLVDRLLRGAAPADLPLVTLDTFELDINLHAAELLDLTVPDDLRLRAARVFP